MTSCVCGRQIPEVTTSFGGIEKTVQPVICEACRGSRSAAFEAHQDEAMAKIRAENSGLPHTAEAYPEFKPVVAQAQDALEQGPLVWSSGEEGDGKTTLAILVGEWALARGWSVRYEHGSVFDDKDEWEAGRSTWLAVDLLILNGLMSGRRRMPDFLIDKVDALIQRRSNHGRKTLITSERPLAWLATASDERFQARMFDLCGDVGEITLPRRGNR